MYRGCFGEWSGEAGAERERARSLIHQANYASWVLRAHWRFCGRGAQSLPGPNQGNSLLLTSAPT